jgi:hypothetical protein
LLAVSALARLVRAGGVDAEFLTIVPDARTAALGGTGTALTDLDANTFYNPANIVSGPHVAATWTHAHWFISTISLDHAGLAYRLTGRFGLAANVQYMQALFTATNERGESTGAFRWYNVSPGVSAAYRILPILSAGLTAKAVCLGVDYLYRPDETLAQGRHALSAAIDAGVQYQPVSVLTLGLAVANLGPNISFETTTGYSLPRVARLGFALAPHVPGPISAFLTADVSRNLFPGVEYVAPWHAGAGLELEFVRLAFVRLGYLYYPGGGRQGITWGVGLAHRGIQIDVGVDSNTYQWPIIDNVRFQVSGRL